MPDYRIIARESRDTLGEGPCWSPARGCLFWVDIMAPALHRMDLASGAVTSWAMPERIGWAIEREGRDDFIIGLKSGFAELSLEPFAIRPIGTPEPDLPDNRLNDAKVDACGRIWAGSKDDRDEQASGRLHRLDPDLRWSTHDEGYQVTNGPTFSPDGETLYHTDSGARTVYAFDFSPDGALSHKRVFLRFEEDMGYPDGMTTDSEGGIWIAHWGGARISRFRADASFDRSIMLPATNITSIAFAGDALDRMFVTSAAMGTENEEHAGALFEVFAGATGLPSRRFAG
ncbi:MAG TPA: SMP-30/gluconolactonase/LRE family protein [Sphingomonas sp.]|nr:SMP-30/gluconolactonase/LRE family protein [Sphingomonas sp.]